MWKRSLYIFQCWHETSQYNSWLWFLPTLCNNITGERERRHSLHKANLERCGHLCAHRNKRLIDLRSFRLRISPTYCSPGAVLNCLANVIVQFPHFFRLAQRTSYKQVYRTFSCYDWKNKVNSCLAIVSFRQRNNLLAKRTLVKRRVGETTDHRLISPVDTQAHNSSYFITVLCW